MKRFIQLFSDKVIGVINGFDRLVLRGTLRQIAYPRGMMGFLWYQQVPLKDFGKYVLKTSRKVKEASCQQATEQQRPIVPLRSGQIDKAEVAEKIALRDGIRGGLIVVLSCLEPCIAYSVVGNKETKKIELVLRPRKCLFLYHYWIDKRFGFMNARIQSWFPFNVQVCINGREWLSREMDRSGISYERSENCFTWIQDLPAAQELMRQQLRVNWKKELDRIAALLNPIHKQIFRNFPLNYYWSTRASEWATDVIFHKQSELRNIYSPMILHGINSFGSGDVMRFLGKKITGRFAGEIISDFKDRPEGVRIKHWVGKNSVKLYDKQGSVLRVETTINDPRDFKIFRPKEHEPRGERKWRPLRHGIADLHRRANISQSCNERYLDALASLETSTPLGKLLEKIAQPTVWKNRRVRAIRPSSKEDLQLLEIVNRGEFALNGFRNRDLRPFFFNAPPENDREKKSRCARISRSIRLLRAHGLIRKVPSTHRYLLTQYGRQTITAILTVQRITLEQLNTLIA